jgi:hypothetical protein
LRTIREVASVWRIRIEGGRVLISDGGTGSKTADFTVDIEYLLLSAQKPANFVTITLTGGRKVTVQTEDIRNFLRAHPAGK